MPEITSVIRATWFSRQPSSSALFVATLSTLLLFFGCALYWMDIAGASALMPASRALAIDKGQLYRLLTSLIAHADLGHLLSNSFLFFTLGYFLYGYFGLWVFPGAAFLGGAITSFFSLLTYGSQTQLIGASGIVFWMGGAWLTLYLLINRQRSLVSRLLRVFGVALALFMPAETFDPSVSYRAHFIGFFLGIFWATGYFLIKRDQFRAAEIREIAIEDVVTEDLDLMPLQKLS